MKLVHIDRLAPGGTALELHPKLTLLRGSGPEVRHRLRSTLRALAGDGAPAETGVIEVSGVRLSMDPSTVEQLGLNPGLDPVLHFGGAASAASGVTLPPPVVVVSNDEAALRAQLREVTSARTELGTRIDMVREGLDPYANAALEVCLGQIDALETRRASLRVEWDRRPGEADTRMLQAAAQLAELRAVVDRAAAVVASGAALQEARSRWSEDRRRADEPDSIAIELAGELAGALARLESMGEADRLVADRIDEAAANLEAAAAWVTDLREHAGNTQVDRTVVQRLEAVRDEIFAVDERSGVLGGRSKRRLVELRSEQAILLDHLGFDTYSAYVMGIPSVRAELDRAEELERAVGEERRLRGVLAEVSGGAVAPSELAAARDDLAQLIRRGVDRLGDGRSVPVHGGTGPVEGSVEGLEQLIDDLRSRLLVDSAAMEAAQLALVEATTAAWNAASSFAPTVPGGPVTVASMPPLPAENPTGDVPGDEGADRLLGWFDEVAAWIRDSETAVVELERLLGEVDGAAEMDRISRWAQVESELDEALDRLAATQERVRAHDEATARLADLRTQELELRDHERELLARIAAADAAIVPPPVPPRWGRTSVGTATTDDRPGADDAETLEWKLIARVARQRSVSFVGSVPMLIEGVPLASDARTSVLERMQRLSGLVQIVLVADDDETARWVDALGDQAGRVDL